MKEVLRVRVGETTLAIEKEAYSMVETLLDEVTKSEGKEAASKVESDFAARVLDRQSINTVVEEELAKNIIVAMGYTPKAPTTPPQTPQTTTANSGVGTLGKIIIVCAKVLLGIFLVGWVLAALGVLVGFISLAAIGEKWAGVVPMDGLSPIVFAGLICAVVVLFMGIVADLGFSLIRCKRVNLKRLVVAGVIWVVFLLWLVFASIRNTDNWDEWARRSEAQIELWEEEIDAWEDRIEGEWEDAVINMRGVEEWDSTYTLSFDSFEGAMRFESFCERFEEMEPYEDRMELHLLRGGKVDVKIENHYEGDRMYRTITISSPNGDTVVTSPMRILNSAVPQTVN